MRRLKLPHQSHISSFFFSYNFPPLCSIMEAPPSSGAGSSAADPLRRRTPFFCARCDRYLANLQGYNRHQNVHARIDRDNEARREIVMSSVQGPVQPTQVRYSSIPQRHFQPRPRYVPYHTQSMNGLVPRGQSIDGYVPRGESLNGLVPRSQSMNGLVPRGQSMNGLVPRAGSIDNVNRSLSGTSNQRTIFVSNVINFIVGPDSYGTSVHVVGGNLIPYNPNLAMMQNVPVNNHGNMNMMISPSAGGISGRDIRRATAIEGSSEVHSGEESENQELDLDLHL
ncbi:uncharacterized protein A4U43_C06F1070 [Asparagus officinalis]|uniref:C2H2-type domain-containing protein n=1 Tax=Asparagus officinalis TaxID=4686 RepID=A0A5P1EKS1_ASPOF|nr:uncharacterized protein A4U43_C06F1070 [Asparagus officinalis]